MDATLTDDPDRFIFDYTPADAADIVAMVGDFRDWDMIASSENREPMLFLLRFGREFFEIDDGGRLEVSRSELLAITNLIRISVERSGKNLPFLKRVLLNLAWKTLRNRLESVR